MTERDSDTNADAAEYWNADAGQSWVRQADRVDRQLAEPGLRVLERVDPGSGDRTLDVGCGTGGLAIEFAGRSPEGEVVGIDLSRPMIELARRRAAARSLDRLRFEVADAQVHAFDGEPFDHVVSRFGVMFFDDPVAAFRNLSTALRPGGRLTFVCWRGHDENPWLTVPRDAAARHIEFPEPDGPGPTRFSDADELRELLGAAALRDVDLAPVDGELLLGGARTLDEAVEFSFDIGIAATELRAASPTVRAAVADSMREALAPHLGEHGVAMPYGAWLVSAARD